ncbi:MAG: beta-N-acetylhexosaminidase [Alcanivorax sp.]|nr:beta-N-acetylhexosaminidase [Alcanivorax sp.]MAY11785.1 beta-N-acetylhexosaminidase [Alcanivorax sp.]MBI53631.1 beta-N-acetylhexosaminidase [Alcanivorax sp.]MBU57789.1 beta-N-acetylhexosaminidase [Alcanivorax sp.]UWN48458.1 Beta-hexosaminidase [Alcanivorax sp. ALC70]
MPETNHTQPLLMLDLAGLTPDQEEKELLRHPAVGGLILFSRNYQEPDQLHQLVRAVRAERPELLIAVDQEGGRVQRFRTEFTRLPPMATLGRYHDRDPEGARQAADLLGELMADELRAFDLDISFAPVLDLDYGHSSVIGDRSFHADPDRVTTLAGAFLDGMARAGMAATGKHFPGHGHVAADSHLELPEDPRDRDALAPDLAPFRALAGRLEGIMPAHVRYPAVAPEPAGFSAHWLGRVLRGECGYRGVIFSDDLAMAGAAAAGDYPQRAEAALTAGCDMVLVCNDRPGAVAVLEWLEGRRFDARVPAATLRGRARAPMDLSRRRQAGDVADLLLKDAR